MQLTIVIPTYNEAKNLSEMVSVLFSLPLPGLKVLVVDDNSPDGTGRVADELAVTHRGKLSVIHRLGKMGLGTAYLEGFKQANQEGAEAIGQMDADFSHPPDKLIELEQALATCDVALGSRYISGGALDTRWPFWRKGLSAFGNTYARKILGLPIKDVTGGFRLWRRETLQGIPIERVRSNGYAFQIEMAYLAHRLGYKIVEIPIYFSDRRWGQSKMSLRIQQEAALRVCQMKFEYRDLLRPHHRVI